MNSLGSFLPCLLCLSFSYLWKISVKLKTLFLFLSFRPLFLTQPKFVLSWQTSLQGVTSSTLKNRLKEKREKLKGNISQKELFSEWYFKGESRKKPTSLGVRFKLTAEVCEITGIWHEREDVFCLRPPANFLETKTFSFSSYRERSRTNARLGRIGFGAQLDLAADGRAKGASCMAENERTHNSWSEMISLSRKYVRHT